MRPRTLIVAAAAALLLGGASASALTLPFTENFDAGSQSWEDSNNDPLTHVGAGGPAGAGDAYVSTEFSYDGFSNPFGGGPVIFRGNASDNASGGAFVGDWLASGVSVVTAWMRQDTAETLSPFLRVANAFNFPGAVIVSTDVLLPNTWTEVTFAIDPSSPLCIGETVSCAVALSDVGNIQFGTDAPASLVTDPAFYTLDLDQVSIVPEPGTALLLLAGLAGLGAAGRRPRAATGRAA